MAVEEKNARKILQNKEEDEKIKTNLNNELTEEQMSELKEVFSWFDNEINIFWATNNEKTITTIFAVLAVAVKLYISIQCSALCCFFYDTHSLQTQNTNMHNFLFALH